MKIYLKKSNKRRLRRFIFSFNRRLFRVSLSRFHDHCPYVFKLRKMPTGGQSFPGFPAMSIFPFESLRDFFTTTPEKRIPVSGGRPRTLSGEIR